MNAAFSATRPPRGRRCCAQEADNGGRRAATRGRPWLLCGSEADVKSNSHAAGRLRVADVYGAAGGREMMRRSVLGIGGSEATDEPQRMIEPDAGAARAQASRAKELCQQRTNVQPPQRSEEVVYWPDTLCSIAKRCEIRCPGLAHVLAEGGRSETFLPVVEVKGYRVKRFLIR